MMAILNKVREKFIKGKFVLLFLNTFIMVFLLFSVGFQITKGYDIPLDEDETIYLSSGKLFYETNSVKSVSCINEERSKIGEFNWYGPVFHIVYGGILKMMKGNYGSILFFNIILLGIIFIKLNFWNTDGNSNSVILNLAIFALTPVSFYTLNYYPVCFFVFINLVVLNFYLKVHLKHEKLILFFFIVLLCITIRINFFFWVFAIFFIPKNHKIKTLIKLIFFILSTLFLVFYMKYFTAKPYQGVPSLRYLYDVFEEKNLLTVVSKLINFGKLFFFNIITNCKLLFRSFDMDVWLFHLLFFMITILKFKRTSKVKNQFKGLYLYIFISYVSLILLYRTSPFYFIKQISFIFPIVVFLLIQLLNRKEILIFCLVCLFILPFRFSKIISNLQARKEISKRWVEIKAHRDSINDFIYSNITVVDKSDCKSVNVLVPYAKLGIPGNLDDLVFPLSKKGISILYTSNPNGETLKDIYKLHNKIRVDYIFALNDLYFDDYKLIDRRSNMRIYKKYE